jgi:hypothetical protein
MRSLLGTRAARLTVTAVAALALTGTAAATAQAGTAKQSAAPRACVTKDLKLTTNFESQAAGYIRVVAKARAGVTCRLDGVYPSASFGSAAYTAVRPAEQAVSDSIVLSGNKAAYAGISPKTTTNNNGIEFDRLHLSLYGDELNSVTLKLSENVTVDRPIATNWHARSADAVPFPS